MLNARYRPLQTPVSLRNQLPVNQELKSQIDGFREEARAILNGNDNRLLLVVGPCSIHDPEAVRDYAERLKKVADQYRDQMLIVMRTFPEKPRTKSGWKGFMYDPFLDGSNRVQHGIYQTRQLLLEISNMGLPVAAEFLDTIAAQFIEDLISWATVGARTSESAVHRALASGLSMPVGIKNGTSGNMQVAVDGAAAAQDPQQLMNINGQGRATLCETLGNPDSHVVLRGGDMGSNYDKASLNHAASLMRASNLEPRVMVDCSHGNSVKEPNRQRLALQSACGELAETWPMLKGFMLESFINPGSQQLDLDNLEYGKSITDPCLGWQETLECIHETAETWKHLHKNLETV